MHIIVGLGNPGMRFSRTRHNMGFMAVDRIAEIEAAKINRLKFQAKTGECNISGEKVLLVKPQTFMNLSGQSVRPVVDFYKIPPQQLILIYDDVDIPTGTIRIRPKGSAGTHNGMRSVVKELGFSDFPRIRIGIGNPDGDMTGHVIGRISKSDKEPLADAADRAARAAITIVESGIDRAMNIFNGNN